MNQGPPKTAMNRAERRRHASILRGKGRTPAEKKMRLQPVERSPASVEPGPRERAADPVKPQVVAAPSPPRSQYDVPDCNPATDCDPAMACGMGTRHGMWGSPQPANCICGRDRWKKL